MGEEIMLDEKNAITMKLLHYFITEKNYNPIILQGVEDEIWLENMNENCEVIRIVSGYIHNNEQLDFDTFKTKRILGKIKKKTFSFNVNILSIFLDLGENVNVDNLEKKHYLYVKAQNEKDITKSELLKSIFPGFDEKIQHKEQGEELFMKITRDINIHNQKDAKTAEKTFRMKTPYITYILLAINLFIFFSNFMTYNLDRVFQYGSVFAPAIRYGEYYRLLTAMFIHANIYHLIVNCYSLYQLGRQMESLLGKFKFITIYLLSGISAGLLSMLFLGNNAASVGASGAIFGLLGSMLYFGYHYRVYLGATIKTQIIPIILLNLGIGFVVPGIDNFAHVGGLIGGVLITMALGIDNKSTKSERINGILLTLIYLGFMTYMAFIYTA